MSITILDIAIITVPLVIIMVALLSRFRERMNRQTDEMKEIKKPSSRSASRNTGLRSTRLRSSRGLQRSNRTRKFSSPRSHI